MLLALSLLLSEKLWASIPEKPIGGVGAGMGNVWIVSTSSKWGGLGNQAALAYNREFWVGLNHENRFLVKELGYSTLGVQLPVTPGTLGFSISHFGYSSFNTTQVGLSYGMKLSKSLAAGVGLAYHYLQVMGDYKSKSAYTVEGGIIYTPVDKLTVGAYFFNPTGSSFTETETLPPLLGIGLAYAPTNSLSLMVQVDDDTETSPSLRVGVEYFAVKQLAVRVGYSTGNLQGMTFGLGWNIKQLSVDFSMGYHSVLGFSPQLSIGYSPVLKRKVK